MERKPNSVYLAARYSRRNELREYAKRLNDKGVLVTSRWLNERKALDTQMSDITPQFSRKTALIDLADINAADAIVFFAEDPLIGTPRGGRHVEFGYGLAKGKRLYVIGPKENVFHFIPGIKHYKSLEAFFEELNGITH